MTNKLVDYHFMDRDKVTVGLPGVLYEYIVANNGVFLHSENEIFEVMMPITVFKPGQKIRGLQTLEPFLKLPSCKSIQGTQQTSKVPAMLLRRMVTISRRALPNEILFHLNLGSLGEWTMETPAQTTSRMHAKPLEDTVYVPIEVHSHNTMSANFSSMDDADETGLRIYGVLGRVDQDVADFRLRVSIYGHRAVLPYELVFESTPEVKNA